MDFCSRARRYAERVLSGEQVAGKWVKAGARRFLDDLERAENGWDYCFDEAAATRACMFLEMLPHIEGKWANPYIVLEDWQVFLVCNLFGWLRTNNRMRRFRRFYLEVARKNGKTALAAGILLYLTFADGEPGAQVYSFATGEKQAKLVWGAAREMVRKEPDFADLGAAYNAKAIFSVTSASTFKPLGKNFDTQDGLNTHGFLADELHAHKNRGPWDVMDSSTGARSQPLGGAITTAGSNTSGICYEVRTYLTKILNFVLLKHDGLGYSVKGDAVEDETWFGLIYTVDDEDQDDPFNEAHWIKANPNMGISVDLDDMRAMARKAAAMSSAINEFLTKKLNIWTNADTAWMDMRAWDKCADLDMDLEDFEGAECITALDLASRVDIAASVKIFKKNELYHLFSQLYLPERAVETSTNSQYEGWVREGALIVTPGEVTDFDLIEENAKTDCGKYQMLEVGTDPWQATQMASHLIEAGATVVEIRQTVQNMSAAMKELEAWVLEGKLKHTGCPVMRWMISNVVCHSDAKENIYPRKERPENKIDGPVAAIMAVSRWLARKPTKKAGFAEL